ncbi:MAG: hypothetical protein HYX67_02810 [Candidatus Melainabacteria bacterium]|nr:hypothetical protein [Candidatus Melainabacteria bacterium]
MTEQTKQNADKQISDSEKQIAETADMPKGEQNGVVKREYVKPTLRKFSQIDYVTAYGVD